MLQEYFYIAFIALILIALIPFLSYRVWKLDKALGLYSFASTLMIICFGFLTSSASFPRLLSFIFPIGLSLNFKSKFLAVATLISFLMLDYVAWLIFLTTSLFH